MCFSLDGPVRKLFAFFFLSRVLAMNHFHSLGRMSESFLRVSLNESDSSLKHRIVWSRHLTHVELFGAAAPSVKQRHFTTQKTKILGFDEVDIYLKFTEIKLEMHPIVDKLGFYPTTQLR